MAEKMFALDNRRDSGSMRHSVLETLLRECQQPTQPTLNELLQYFFQTESTNAFLLIKQFNETGKERSKILIEHLNNQGLKQTNRHSSASMNSDLNALEEREKVAHTMKLFRLLSLIIHQQVPGLPALIKESLLLTNCLQAISRCKDDPNMLAQACYFFAALTATLPGEIVQHTEAILNIFKATCKYLFKNLISLRQLAIQPHPHSLDNVQLWIVNQSAHALFYTLYTAYPCNFLYQIQREFQRNENADVFEHIFIPMFQRVRFNPRLIDTDRKREIDKDRRSRHDSYQMIYEARQLSLDSLFGRESPAHRNWMHQEMKKILPLHQFKRQSPARSLDQLFDGHRSATDLSTPVESTSKRSGSSPFQKFKEKIKSFVRPSSASSPATAITTPDIGPSMTTSTSNNTLSIPTVASSILTSPSPALASDMRAVKTMPELQSSGDQASSSSSSTPLIRRSNQEHQIYVRSVITTMTSIYEQNLPSHWTKILGRYDPNLLTVLTPHRQATFYVSPSEQSLDNQQQQQLQFDDGSPTSANERRQRCASASCASSQHVHSPVLAAPTTSTDDILSRTQSLSTKQRTRHSSTLSNTTGSLHHRSHLAHQNECEEDNFDDNILIDGKTFVDPWKLQIPPELYSSVETKGSIIDELIWNEHDFISIPLFDLNDIVNDSCSSMELKRFDRLYECHSSYETFLTDQYKKIWEHLSAKQKTNQKHFNDLQSTRGFMETLQLEVQGHLTDELKLHESNSKRLSDENSLLGDKVVELGKVTSRRKQISSTEEKDAEIRELEKSCEQLRKNVNNETLKLNHLRLELEDNERETKAAGDRLEHLKTITHHIVDLNDLNQQLECQYLRFTDEMPMAVHPQAVTTNLLGDDDEQPPFQSTSSTTTNARDEISDIDSISFNEEHREEVDDLQQAEDSQAENYDQLLAEMIELLKNRNVSDETTMVDIEGQAYDLLLEYMKSKANMQDYLLEHNTRYSTLYLETQEDYIKQVEKELSSNDSIVEQMQHVSI